ncbi:hypothetical protein AC249_AIPGENE18274 [Exaiptasia diaphana]|nr:hypothetical protein AC249_AIPGENE18274 [Exaiptasia diaphana]
MRKARQFQATLSYKWLELPHAKELETLAGLIDKHPKIADLFLQDLCPEGTQSTGAEGMPADFVFKALLLKQMHQWSYDELHFHLSDSQTFRAFVGLGLMEKTPGRSTIAAAIKKIRPETLEAVHEIVLVDAKTLGIEDGHKTRVDCTVVDSLIHKPSDSQLLWDGIRVLSLLMKKARRHLPDAPAVPNRRKRAKRRCREIATAHRNKSRIKPYRDLVGVAEEIRDLATDFSRRLEASASRTSKVIGLQDKLVHKLGLLERVIDQTRRRVFEKETVPAQEKVVSLFEEHTDIIRKDHRDTYYGHKICLNGGRSNMILDCRILEGNPSDATLAVEAVERQKAVLGYAPRQVTFDGAFASAANLEAIKELGSKDVVFTKGKSLKVSDMAKSLAASDWRNALGGRSSRSKAMSGAPFCRAIY